VPRHFGRVRPILRHRAVRSLSRDDFASGVLGGRWCDRVLRRLYRSQTISRLVALVAQGFPLQCAPGIFVAAALIIQMVTATFLVSGRMSSVWPSLWERFLFAFIYVALPNSLETHRNPDQCPMASRDPGVFYFGPKAALDRAGDVIALALSGLSGPFCLLLIALSAPKRSQYGLRFKEPLSLRSPV
jgi:hypothetical protein